MYCPCSDAVARRAWVESVLPSPAAVPTASSSNPPVLLPSALVAPSCVPAGSLSSCAPGLVGVPGVRVSSVLSPGPTYDGPEPDPALMIWPLSECPDWPINDSWRDFAFLPVVFSPRSEQSNNGDNSDLDSDCP